ncbi:predicted protein [Nematostella vectensis]|uniref:Uncharacterized protein n=1 Tax=Nematostella vectensis TaxID=45351 RepID=A7TA44_NEMVE|nr:predicted protein [Nematostella vectensis]|eukprot:XP_001619226.1 hypothetical protein NEMVEDRAFT_v1g224378 [Nematostella vectensis]
MTTERKTQLTSLPGYNPKQRMIFSKPIHGEVYNSRPKVEFKRINISTRNEDGTAGDLILPTERLYSFGVAKNNFQGQDHDTYTLPLCLWDKEGPTPKQKILTDTLKAIVDHCIDHLLENREAINHLELTRRDLTKLKGGLDPLYWKTETVLDPTTGRTGFRKVPGKGPVLYARLIYSARAKKFMTLFSDAHGNNLNAEDLIGQYCHATAAIRVESIFIGAKISLQLKVYEAIIEPRDENRKRLLAPPAPTVETEEDYGDVFPDNESDLGSID